MASTELLKKRWMYCALLAIAMAAGCVGTAGSGGGGADDDDNDDAGVVDGEPNGSADVYYVSDQGDDDATGLSQATAYRTIARAVGTAGPGDVVAILPGTYSEAVTMEGFGSAQASITIRGEGGRPVLDGLRQLSTGIWCAECTNVVFENLEFTGFTDMGILVTLSTSITIRDLVVHDNGFAATGEWVEGYGIHADDSSGITIEDCEVYENGPNPQRPGRLMGTGIDTFNLTDSVIRNNRSYNNTGGGMLVEDSTNVLVEGNEIFGNDLDATAEEWWDGGIWIDGGRDITLRNNTIHDNLGPGVEISDEDNQQPTGYVLENNTITGNLYGIYIWNFGTTELPPADILELTDNDVSGNTTQDIWIVDWLCPPDDPCE